MIKIKNTYFAPKDLFLFFVAFLAVGFGAFNFFQKTIIVDAHSGKFNPGRIIDDSVMSNYSTMSVSDIQRFLESKNSCNNRNISLAEKYKGKFDYHIENGKFICMHEEKFNGETAAEIIYNAARKHKINPQVLIVLLEKEQGLITDDWPNSVQYRSATGFGCPDTAPCDKKYYGLKNQIDRAAELFREVLDGGFTNFPLGNNFINYHPESSCGGSSVKIQNLATSALYRYTPYQPNSASLSAHFGRGDGCSSYGNRNFYNYFVKWFGNPVTAKDSDSELASYSSSDEVVSTGIYELESTSMSNKYIDIENNGMYNLANAQLENGDGTSSQKFYAKYHYSGGYYTFMSMNSGKYLNLKKTESGSNVHQYSQTNDCDERWKLKDIGGGKISISSICDNNLKLDVQNLNGKLNVYVNKNSSQTWYFRKEGESHKTSNSNSTSNQVINSANQALANSEGELSGTYYIRSKIDQRMVLDITNAGQYIGAKVQLWLHNGSKAQQFVVQKRSGTDKYTIINKNSNKNFDAENAGRHLGTRVHQWLPNNSCAQDWELDKMSDGSYRIRSGCSKLVLDVNNASMYLGNIIQLWQDNSSNAQRWIFEKIQ